MKYSTNAIRRGSILALVLIGLLQAPSGPASVRRGRVLAARAHSASRFNHERSFSRMPPRDVDQKIKTRGGEAYGRLPIRFEANEGQTDAKVKFLSRGAGYGLFLTQSEAVLTLRRERSRGGPEAQSTVRMKLIGADPAPLMEGLDRLPGRSNYIIGRDASRWRRNVESFAKVRYRSVYPGIDLIYYGNQRQIEYDFVVAPGADPNVIRLGFVGLDQANFVGLDQVNIDAQGDLVLKTANGEIRQRKPVAYQEVDGIRREITCSYALKDKQEVGFELGEYDHTRPLVIDPVMAYSTYLGGGSDANYPGSIAVDAAGNAYVTGVTYALDFPTSNPLQPNPAGNGDVFVAKLNPEGSALVYSTYLGGSGYDEGLGIAVDEDGNAYLTGRTQSLDFPTKNPLQPGLAGDDIFVTKLNADGSALVYSTHLGGTSVDIAWDLAIDNERNVYVAGETFSNDFPTVNPLQATRSGGRDVFAAKIKADGSALVYSTYLGGGDDRLPFDDDEDPKGIAVDRFGCLYLAGTTASPDFPTANPLKSTLADGDRDAFVTKISADGSAFVYSTYLGGGDFDEAWDLAVDASGAAYVTGKTFSPDFPTVNPLQPVLSGTSDAFVTKISPTGSALLYSTYLGGTRGEWGFGIGIDSRNSIYVTGLTLSDDFPTLDAAQPIPDGSPDIPDNGFVAKLKADGSRLIYSTYLGGRGVDEGDLIAVDARGNAYVFGFTDSDDVPTTPGAIRREPRSPNQHHSECFITKISASRRHHQGHDKDCEDDHDGEGRHSRKARH
jgi:Beta-propeller repeat